MSRLLMALFIVAAIGAAQIQAAPNTSCKTENGSFTVKKDGKNYRCTSKETCTTTELVCEPKGGEIKCGNKTSTTTSYDNCSAVQASGPGSSGVVLETRPDVLAPDTSSPPSRGPRVLQPGGVLQRN